jgi:hypothetical protein
MNNPVDQAKLAPNADKAAAPAKPKKKLCLDITEIDEVLERKISP